MDITLYLGGKVAIRKHILRIQFILISTVENAQPQMRLYRIALLVRYLYVQFALATGKVARTVRVQLDVQFPFGMDIHQAFRHWLTVGIV